MATRSPDRTLVLLYTLFLIFSTAAVFHFASLAWGSDWATLVGFAFYQIVWGIVLPLILLGGKGYLNLFRVESPLFTPKNLFYILLLALTVVGAFFGYFLKGLKEYSIVVFFIGIPLATLNGFCEEVIWRGLFMQTFRKSVFLSIVYPTVLFGAWHISSELVNLNKGLLDMLPLAVIAMPLGLVYAVVARRNGSIRWVAIAHSMIGILAFGVPLSTSLLLVAGLPLR
jgi:membrane protease YdiL (CAAX protease family)